jgi:hypothetical protein
MVEFKNPHIDPPGSWFFVHPETGDKIAASSFANLVTKSKAWMVTNNFPVPRDLNQIIAQQICDRVPNFCISSEPPTFADKAREFAAAAVNWVRQGMRHVSHEVFEERLAQCQACPLYGGAKTLGLHGCGRCGCTSLKLYAPESKCPLPEPRWKAVT